MYIQWAVRVGQRLQSRFGKSRAAQKVGLVQIVIEASAIRGGFPNTEPSEPLGGARVVVPRPGSWWFWEAWTRHSYRPPPRDLGVRGASMVRCGLSCLVGLNSDLFRLCGSLHGLDTFSGGWVELIKRQQQQQKCLCDCLFVEIKPGKLYHLSALN